MYTKQEEEFRNAFRQLVNASLAYAKERLKTKDVYHAGSTGDLMQILLQQLPSEMTACNLMTMAEADDLMRRLVAIDTVIDEILNG